MVLCQYPKNAPESSRNQSPRQESDDNLSRDGDAIRGTAVVEGMVQFIGDVVARTQDDAGHQHEG